MTFLESLHAHTEVCEEIYRLMLELNRSLKAGTQVPDATLLDRKKEALGTLENSLSQIRSFSGQPGTTSAELRAALERCQRTILKALLLDRENEQLLLKNAMIRPAAVPAARPAPAHLAKLYGKHR